MGKFAVKKTATGIKFNLLASNGQIIGVSEVYSGKEAGPERAENQSGGLDLFCL